MTYDADTIKEMIPLYLNGRLPAAEKEAFLQGLEEYPDLASEMADFQDIDGVYRDLEDTVPFPDQDAMFSRIMGNIDKEAQAAPERAPVRKSVGPGLGEKLVEFLRTTFQSPRVAWSVAAVQIVLLAAILVGLPAKNTIETLTSSGTGVAQRQELNVVFDENAAEKAMRDLMVRNGVTIVGGPAENGLYVIAVSGEQNVETVSAALRDSGIVSFVEKRY